LDLDLQYPHAIDIIITPRASCRLMTALLDLVAGAETLMMQQEPRSDKSISCKKGDSLLRNAGIDPHALR
jgi:hypothetical protein